MSKRRARRRSRLRIHHLSAQTQSLIKSFALIVFVYASGIAGFFWVGGDETTFIDAFYMTMITLTTVGYGEVVNVSASTSGKLFTCGLLLVGTGSFVYFFSNFTAFVVEGNLEQFLWRRKMRKSVAALSGHSIVCGSGTLGEHVVKELVATERPFVLIESDERRAKEIRIALDTDFPVVVGDATEDESLIAAGIDRASGLAACVSSDKDNLLITVSARLMRKDLRIVSRCIDDRVQKKMRQAGADAIVSPNMIGGLRLVSELVRPVAVTFLDTMLRDKERSLRVEEHTITAVSPQHGRRLAEFRAAHPTLLVVACRDSDESWTFNPPDDFVLAPGMRVVFIGDPKARSTLELEG